VSVIDRRECNCLPAFAGRKATVVEITIRTGIGEAEERYGACRNTGVTLD